MQMSAISVKIAMVQHFALSVYQFHSAHSVLSSHSCYSSQADLCHASSCVVS